MFSVRFSKELVRKLNKINKKNKKLFETIINKMREIKENPLHYKPLRYDMKGYRRVHIMKSFVLIFKVDRKGKMIIFEDFDHHDRIYKR
jgi:YafQ family addiction module toxin component